MLLFVVEENAMGRPIEIVVLPGLERPQKCSKAEKAEEQGCRDQVDENIQRSALLKFRRSALPVTASDDDDIATAAIKGVIKPAIANGMAIAL